MAQTPPTEVLPGIHLIQEQGRFGALKPSVNIYVLAGQEGLMFDSGYGNPWFVEQVVRSVRKIERDLSHRNVRVARVMPSHTHPDHFSGVFHLKRKLGLKILSTPEMAGHLTSWAGPETRDQGGLHGTVVRMGTEVMQRWIYGSRRIPVVDETMAPGQTVAVDDEAWQVLSVPGHCDDHIALYSRKRGILLAGDHIMRSVTTWLGPPRSNLKHYVASLEKLLDLPDLRLILSAHGKPIDHPRERIREAIAHRRERTGQVLNLIDRSGASGMTIRSIARGIYSGKERNKRILSRGWIDMTLRMLEEEGLIRSRTHGPGKRFYPA